MTRPLVVTALDRPRPRGGPGVAPPASLEALLGVPRAALLRALDRATTAGQLATRLGLTPSGVTHHLRALEPAGLVARERHGRFVRVHRTIRGTQLLALYDLP
jgi:DNA-binding MarR family transcriptional regulator